MSIQKSDAFVLLRHKFRDTSLITTFYTRDFGKLKAISKGIRKQASQDLPLYEPFTHVDIVFYEKARSDLQFLSEASPVYYFPRIRADLDRICWASVIVEMLDALVPVAEPDGLLYNLLWDCLYGMETGDPMKITAFFELQLAQHTGYFPAVEMCIGCGEADSVAAFVSIEDGGYFCQRCKPGDRSLWPVTPRVIMLMRKLIALDYEQAMALNIPTSVLAELHQLVGRWVHYKFDRGLSSLRFLYRIGLLRATAAAKPVGPLQPGMRH